MGGKSGERTVFAITLTQHQAKDITPYSLNSNEQEVLLPPESTFRVVSSTNLGLCMIQLEEVESVDQILDLSSDGSGFVAAASAVRKETGRKASVSVSGAASSSAIEGAKSGSSNAARK